MEVEATAGSLKESSLRRGMVTVVYGGADAVKVKVVPSQAVTVAVSGKSDGPRETVICVVADVFWQ